MTRRQWLAQCPPPEPGGALIDRAQQFESAGDAASGKTLRNQAAACKAKCPQHPAEAIYRHRDRPEDLYTCPKGPLFLLWTLIAGRPQLARIELKDLPDFDAVMPGA